MNNSACSAKSRVIRLAIRPSWEWAMTPSAGPSSGRFDAALVYDPADPATVQLELPQGKVWVFARSLLADALDAGDAGIGDLAVYKLDRPRQIQIALYSEKEDMDFVVTVDGWAGVKKFLAATFRLIPEDEESPIIESELDQVLDALLSAP